VLRSTVFVQVVFHIDACKGISIHWK